MAEVIAFAGPSLAGVADHPGGLLAGVDVWPPARRGDVLVALAERPATIVLLDGYYYTVPAVTHKELLYALSAGVRVIGAASMGALRAVEMERFGMIGVGRVFAEFRRGNLEGDDEVAVLHGPAEAGYPDLTVALVELRHALDRLVRAGAIEAAGAVALLAAIKAMPFTERTPGAVQGQAHGLLGVSAAGRLQRALGEWSIKRDDARQALEIAHHPPRARPPAPQVPVTTFLSHYREWYLRVRQPGEHSLLFPTFRKAWGMAQVFHPDAAQFVRALRVRFLLAAAARAIGVEPTSARIEAAVGDLEAALRRHRTRARLPLAEVVDEATEHARAEAALDRCGTLDRAADRLLAHLGLDRSAGVEHLIDLLDVQEDVMVPWLYTRAFLFTAAFDAAWETAEAIMELYEAYRDWAGDRRLARAAAVAVAADLWNTTPDMVEQEAQRRALQRSHGFSAGFLGVMELVAPAERLRQPINAYPERRRRLATAPLRYALRLPGSVLRDPPLVRSAT